MIKASKITSIILMLSILSACAGVRLSYQSALNADQNALNVCIAEEVEVLAVGNGFPGWWGIYPTVVSNDPSVAKIQCLAARSAVPFREPGVVFGGTVCTVRGEQSGRTHLIFQNSLSDGTQPEQVIEVHVADCQQARSSNIEPESQER